jgi:hypothetical protein
MCVFDIPAKETEEDDPRKFFSSTEQFPELWARQKKLINDLHGNHRQNGSPEKQFL